MSMSVADNIRVPLLYTVAARVGHHVSKAEADERCMELLKLVGLDAKAAKNPRDLTAGRNAQARARPRHGG